MSSPEIISGFGSLGTAIRGIGNARRRGIFVRHRLDGKPRLMFDLYLASDNYFFAPLRYSVAFTVVERIPKNNHVGLLMSRDVWTRLGQQPNPDCTEPWLNFDECYSWPSGSSWNGHGVVMATVLLGSPTTTSTLRHGSWRFPVEMGLVDCEHDLCLVTQTCWRKWGESFEHDGGTCFFPNDRTLSRG